MRGTGRVAFAAGLLFIVGTINVIYGIGALSGAKIFHNDPRFLLTNPNALGWVLIILGLIQFTGALSLMGGGAYGRVIGFIAASLGAIGGVLSIGATHPWWSLAVVFLCVWVVNGILVYGKEEKATGG
jgi:hypothetical protein